MTPRGPTIDFWIGSLGFGEPMVLAIGGCIIALLVVGLVADAYWRRRLTGQIGELPLVRAMLASVSPGRRRVKAVLLVLAAIGIVIALAEPRVRSKSTVERRGMDLVLAMDVSKSMLVSDVAPTRLDRAHALADELLVKLDGDRTAAVVFAGGAAHFPLTDDQDVTRRFLFDLGPLDLPVGSDLAEAVRASRCMLRPDLYDQLGCPGILGRRGHGGDPLPGEDDDDDDRRRRGGFGARDADPDELDADEEEEEEREQRGRAIVIFTDGADEAAKAAQEVAIARQLGIAVFVVGFGTPKGGEVWDLDSQGKPSRVKRDASGNAIVSKRDDEGMRRLAAASGDEGRYIVANETGPADPGPLVQALASVQRGVTARKVKNAKHVYHWFLFPALMLLVAEALLSTRRRRGDVAPVKPPRWYPLPSIAVGVLALFAASSVAGFLIAAYLHLTEHAPDILSPRYQRLFLWAVIPTGLAAFAGFQLQRRRVAAYRASGVPRPWPASIAATIVLLATLGLVSAIAQLVVDPRSAAFPRVALALAVPVLFTAAIVFMTQLEHRRAARVEQAGRKAGA